MSNFLEKFGNIVSQVDGFVWGPVMIIFLLGTHIFLTWRTGFIQKDVFRGIKYSLKKDGSKKGDLSIFGSLMTALSSTVGTGNIIGVGTAVALGGAGAVLWTWIGGIFGIATKYAESYIAVKYRRKNADGTYIGGAMTAFEHLGLKPMAIIFAVLAALAAFGIGNATQANAIVDIVSSNYNISATIVGIVLVVLVGVVVFGGIKSISKVCERLVPVMAIVYIVGCLVILGINIRFIPQTFLAIVQNAFTGRAVYGGLIGTVVIQTIRYGVARGLFSNEAGMGSAPMATAAGQANNAVKPALVGSTGVFWDTVVICLLTGLVLVSSIIANPGISIADVAGKGTDLVSLCFGQIPYVGVPLLVFGIITFSYSTILGWSYYGETCFKYLFGVKYVKIYQALWVIITFVGAVGSLNIVWDIADILNALMCIPNVIAVLMLSKQMWKDTKYYLPEEHIDEEDPEIQ